MQVLKEEKANIGTLENLPSAHCDCFYLSSTLSIFNVSAFSIILKSHPSFNSPGWSSMLSTIFLAPSEAARTC